MAVIIHQGRPKPKVARHRCPNCDSLVEYTDRDEREDYIETKYVGCPSCKQITYSRDIKWQYPKVQPHDPDQERVWDPNR